MLAKTEGFVKQKIGQNPKKTLFPKYFFRGRQTSELCRKKSADVVSADFV